MTVRGKTSVSAPKRGTPNSQTAKISANHSKLTPFDTNWKKGSGATPLTTQDL